MEALKIFSALLYRFCASFSEIIFDVAMGILYDEIRRRTGKEVLESQIQEIMRGKEMVLPPKYSSIVEAEIKKYVKGISDILNENKYNTETLPQTYL